MARIWHWACDDCGASGTGITESAAFAAPCNCAGQQEPSEEPAPGRLVIDDSFTGDESPFDCQCDGRPPHLHCPWGGMHVHFKPDGRTGTG